MFIFESEVDVKFGMEYNIVLHWQHQQKRIRSRFIIMCKLVWFFALLAVAFAEPAPKAGLIASAPAVAAVVPHTAAYVAPYASTYAGPYATAYAGPYATAYSGALNYGYNSIYNHPYNAVHSYAPYANYYNSMYRSAFDYPHIASTYAAHPYNYVY
ncbi:uncharacterized protein LOC123674201 isoform X1 [Harmonia axyridis]|uniref:uncharacterized protein LOC123674201 isoform X1 n=1 Tax=Harmonia axyridis TaxID=115357 RepID=UPI001E275256|nr:uncharacterized protein LOC123674201 isoform X1 [Harmonia axyridis]